MDAKTTDPLTSKGQEIMSAMKGQYGPKKGEEVFYASANKGVITGVHDESEIVSVLPESVTAATINEQNRRFWGQQDPANPANADACDAAKFKCDDCGDSFSSAEALKEHAKDCKKKAGP